MSAFFRSASRCALIPLLAALVANASQREAQALVYGTVTATFQGVKPGQNVGITFSDGTVSTVAGMFEWELAGNGFEPDAINGHLLGSNPFSGKFFTNCIEIGENVTPGATYTFSIVDLTQAPNMGKGVGGQSPGSNMTSVQADLLRELYGKFRSEINTSLNNASEKEDAAAFQLAIWETVFETVGKLGRVDNEPGNLDKSFAQAASATIDKANAWLSDILNNDRPKATLFGLTNSGKNGVLGVQDQVIELDIGGGALPPPPLAMPEPASLAVWGLLGLVAVAGRKLRRR